MFFFILFFRKQNTFIHGLLHKIWFLSQSNAKVSEFFFIYLLKFFSFCLHPVLFLIIHLVFLHSCTKETTIPPAVIHWIKTVCRDADPLTRIWLNLSGSHRAFLKKCNHTAFEWCTGKRNRCRFPGMRLFEIYFYCWL